MLENMAGRKTHHWPTLRLLLLSNATHRSSRSRSMNETWLAEPFGPILESRRHGMLPMTEIEYGAMSSTADMLPHSRTYEILYYGTVSSHLSLKLLQCAFEPSGILLFIIAAAIMSKM